MIRFKLSIAFFLSIVSFSLYSEADNRKPPGYAVASAHPLATNAGLEIFAQGGNAFDAAIAVSAVLGVVAPYHSGLGGGAYWLLHDVKTNKNSFIDAREVAPQAARETMFQDKDGKVIEGLSLNGGLSAAIPGLPASMVYVAQHYGRLPLSKSLAPAIKIAQEGFIVDHKFWTFTLMGDRTSQLKRFHSTAKIFLNQGEPYQLGQRLIQKDLANTLKIFAEKGMDGFYKGEIAEKMVKSIRENGGIWTLKDLADYKIKRRAPLMGSYHGMKIITAPPSSAGGVALLSMMNILSNYELNSFSEAQWVHHIVEAMRLAYWQRTEYLGDPDFVEIPLEKLLSQANAKALTAYIKKDKATPSDSLPKVDQEKSNHPNTTHISVIDAEGNRVALTQTVNYIFGSSVIAEGTGVLLNDEMDDFSSKPGEKNVFGLVGSQANAIAPGKRPLSSMTPTFLELPDRVAILGTPGGSRIPTMVLLASLVFENSYGAISMVSAMRFHHQYLPDTLFFEPESFSQSLQQTLVEMGYQLMALKQYYGDMQAITWDKKMNLLTAAADPRHIGLAAAIGSNDSGYGVKH